MAIKHTSGEELSTLPATSGDGSAVLMFPQKKKKSEQGQEGPRQATGPGPLSLAAGDTDRVEPKCSTMLLMGLSENEASLLVGLER